MADQWVQVGDRQWHKEVVKASVTTLCDITEIGIGIYSVEVNQTGQVDPNVTGLSFGPPPTLAEAKELGDALIAEFANTSLLTVEFTVEPLSPLNPKS